MSAQEPSSEPLPDPHAIKFHGFVSEGGFLSTANDYIGTSSRGSLELFEVGLNASTEVADRLRAGIQLFARDVGNFHDSAPRIDWAFLDYKWRPWLGLRAGVIKMPFGLYNEYVDVDSARLPLLMPQSVYSVRQRDVLLAHRGFSLYGEVELGTSSSLEYQIWLGTLTIPDNALVLNGGSLDRIDTKYVAGVQAFWHTPIDGLRVGATFLRASIDFHVTLDDAVLANLAALGLVEPTFDGKVTLSQRFRGLIIGSVEYIHDKWTFAAEYARSINTTTSTLPMLLPPVDNDSELGYGLVARRLSPRFEVGAYYSFAHTDVDDRRGLKRMGAARYFAFQRDVAATVRFDVNSHWLWKLEGHFIHGAADLDPVINPDPDPYWGMVLVKTTVTF